MPRFLSFVRDQYTHLPISQPPANIADATYVVTGANTGIGLECAKHLVQMGVAHVVLAVRSVERGEAALQTIETSTGRRGVCEVWPLDLASFDSVEAFAKRLDTLPRLDALLQNAGVAAGKHQMMEGAEMCITVNAISPFLLAARALPKLQETARRHKTQTRLTFVTSGAILDENLYTKLSSVQGGDMIEALSDPKDFMFMEQYPLSKLMGLYTMRQLAALYPVADTNVTINAANPGLCYTELDRNGTTVQRMAMAVMRKFLARSAEEGSRMLLYAAFAGPESHGSFCSECQVKDNTLPEWIVGQEGLRIQKNVWDEIVKYLESRGHPVGLKHG